MYAVCYLRSDGMGEKRATSQYPDLFTMYLGKNQSYVVAEVDIRGSGGHGEMLRQATVGSLGLKESYDIQNIVE